MADSPYRRLVDTEDEFLNARDGYQKAVTEWGNYTLKIEQVMTDFEPRHKAIKAKKNKSFGDVNFDRAKLHVVQAEEVAIGQEEDQAMVAVLDSYYEAIKDPFIRYQKAAAELLTALDLLGDPVKDFFPLKYERGNLRHERGVKDELITSYENVRNMLATSHTKPGA